MTENSRTRRLVSRAGAGKSDTEKPVVKRTIVVKRIVAAAAASHSGSWKVAFADFAMAMMAFFLTMWLMGATTADERGGISQYFTNPTMIVGASPSPTPSVVAGSGGAPKTPVQMGSDFEAFLDNRNEEAAEWEEEKFKKEDPIIMVIDGEADREQQRLQSLKANLKEAIESELTLRQYADHIIMDLTGEGLRIQMIDKENRSMFPVGSAELEPFGSSVLEQLAPLIAQVPNHISIGGHTDSRQYHRPGYSNWELSIDRANAARRALIAGGLTDDKIGRVVGLSTSAPLDRGNLQNPINRRISIIVLNKRTEQAIVQESGGLVSVQTDLQPTS